MIMVFLGLGEIALRGGQLLAKICTFLKIHFILFLE
jgi:hypothetical protein